ncbi:MULTISPECIES: Tim44 domain-containing protein [Variovorax]|jgi:predicted lipid-binding transport protein (Tim44 family)|uniref:Tim44 domain-containing protein n=1 Tax=Variovorax TaxID=34072 RepID=UPI00086EF5D7|nr:MULTISPECIES: Tim44-like domain-containing protein [Variovorax]MBN8756489.1 Tim44 domain-containing protein [Variovorax sp.]ODU13512.1 MAG: preprotein translocase subunit Tim44 [Variovorax sp. SCN 67-85]ODV24984.1 MAG: preprotein translocase subunit Tim44 [Variovorax sp. SCN 67-20]OJZ11120.1 MAG: transporter [Variovorax sp. 67-131]UKI06461.1 Tim44-like domain-containing protein [Variovorax paradoxus]
MKSLGSLFLAVALVLGSVQAEAARMGGGKSVGRQSSNVTQRQATPPAAPGAPAQQGATNAAAAKPGAAAPAAAAPKRPWGAMLGGLAAGLGLAWLAHSLGLGAGFGNILLIGLLVLAGVVVWRMIKARSQQASGASRQGGFAFQGAGASPSNASAPAQYSPANVGNDASARPWERNATAFDATPAAGHGSSLSAAGAAAGGSMIGSALGGSQSWGIPAGFDVEGFLGAAKRNFVTLQDAWDRADVSMLRSMMTDSMVDEIRSQLADRASHTGGASNKTEVVMLDAKLLGIEELPDAYMASVEFSGMIREDASAGPGPFREVWNMTKPISGTSGWLVAGVQALQ